MAAPEGSIPSSASKQIFRTKNFKDQSYPGKADLDI